MASHINSAAHRMPTRVQKTVGQLVRRNRALGGVGHSYTNREVDALGYPGFACDERADRLAWNLMLALLDEVL